MISGRRGLISHESSRSRHSFDRPVSHPIDKRGWMDNSRDDDMADIVDDYELAESYGFGSLVPFLHSHFKTCPIDTPKTDCRPFYMPCKSDMACGISCRVNDYSCGSCSDTNSFRKVCQCCDNQPSAALIKSPWSFLLHHLIIFSVTLYLMYLNKFGTFFFIKLLIVNVACTMNLIFHPGSRINWSTFVRMLTKLLQRQVKQLKW